MYIWLKNKIIKKYKIGQSQGQNVPLCYFCLFFSDISR